MVSIDGTDISGATIDGTEVQEITMDGDVVWVATLPQGVIEDFEWGGNLSDRYDGRVGGASLEENSTLEGDYLLNVSGSETTILNDYLSTPQTEQGHFYSIWQSIDEDDARNSVLMNAEDDGGLYCYGVSASRRDDHVAIRKMNGGVSHIDSSSDWDVFEVESESYSVSQDGTLVFGQNSDGNITLEYYDGSHIEPENLENENPDVSITASNEDDYTSGKIGFSTTANRDNQLFDYYYNLGEMDSPP